jgi:hypothetical protein
MEADAMGMDELGIGAGVPEPDVPTPDEIGVKQDWIITLRLTDHLRGSAASSGWYKAELEHQIETKMRQIDGIEVKQVMIAADGPRYR